MSFKKVVDLRVIFYKVVDLRAISFVVLQDSKTILTYEELSSSSKSFAFLHHFHLSQKALLTLLWNPSIHSCHHMTYYLQNLKSDDQLYIHGWIKCEKCSTTPDTFFVEIWNNCWHPSQACKSISTDSILWTDNLWGFRTSNHYRPHYPDQ